MINQEYTPLEEMQLVKSNSMVSAKYQSTLLENKIMSIALTRIENNPKSPEAPLRARLYPGELKRLIGDPTHIYRILKSMSKMMTGRSMLIEDGKGNFKAFAIVNCAEYQDGCLTIEFNSNIKPHILGLEKNYTTLELSILTNFSRNSSFRLYELLKREMYKSNKNINDGLVVVEYRLSELRFMIGLVNSDDQKVKNMIARMGDNIDWDELYEKIDNKNKKYEATKDFEKWVLKPAEEELKEKSNIRFKYEKIKEGRATKIIRFFVYPNIPESQQEIKERTDILDKGKYRQTELIYETYKPLFDKYTGHNSLTKEDIELLLKKAAYDEGKVIKAISMADKQESLNSYMGWLIRCIENDYEETEVFFGSEENAKDAKKMFVTIEEKQLDLAEKMWVKIKNKDNFEDFVKHLKANGIILEAFETLYTADERNKEYSQWFMDEYVKKINN